MGAVASVDFKPGDLVKLRNREWVVLPETRDNLLKLRPFGGAERDATLVYLPIEPEIPVAATISPPDPNKPGSHEAALLLRDALRLKLRAGAGPFRSFGNLNVEPRAYQLVPLLMALKLDPVRLLIADDVGIGKTIEAGLIARELLDRGEIDRLTVICPPHLCEQWKRELAEKFSINAEVVRSATAARLERKLLPDESLFHVYPFTVVSLDYIKSERRRTEFQRVCPEFVIVDEAHTCVRASSNTRHQRYKLLKGLADPRERRGMVFLTATPHSGDEVALHNLLGLIDPKFQALADMEEDGPRRRLRDQLAQHFVQRRRGDIDEWNDSSKFPVRESREATYRLSDQWGNLFDDVVAYARAMVRRTEGGERLQQRMSWWAALALFRCVSSSPAAASRALGTRLQATEGETEPQQIDHLDRTASERVMDEVDEDSFSMIEHVPAGTVDDQEDAEILRELIDRANRLHGPTYDPKLKLLFEEIKQLLKDGFCPVIFCRFIATAKYVGEQLRKNFDSKKIDVSIVTSEQTSDQREERVESLSELADSITPVLVATDCLSEGVNLQSYFNAVVHYDLNWNPTRHEQREGRADRFGQSSPIVRTLMLYGENNPVDGAVLRVILKKAEKIQRELGVSVPLPTDNNQVVETIMRAVLLHGGAYSRGTQGELDFGETETELENAWREATNKASRTVFSQRRLRPQQVLPEWEKAESVLGGAKDVERFVGMTAERLGARLESRNGYFKLPIAHLPKALQDRLESIGLTQSAKLAFDHPIPTGGVFVHRAHPLVAAFADHVTELSLNGRNTNVAARCGAFFTSRVSVRTVLYLLRLRNHIQIERLGQDRKYNAWKSLIAEECFTVASEGAQAAEFIKDENASALLSLEPGHNMSRGQKSHHVQRALESLSTKEMQDALERVASERAELLLSDHRRIRDASDAKGLRYTVVPAWPVDLIGVYVFVPMASF